MVVTTTTTVIIRQRLHQLFRPLLLLRLNLHLRLGLTTNNPGGTPRFRPLNARKLCWER